MKKIFLALLLSMFAFAASAQQVVKGDDMQEFSAISLSGNLKVELFEAQLPGIEVVLYNSDVNKLKWTVNEDLLSVQLRSTSGRDARADVKIYYTKSLTGISVSGSELMVTEPIKTTFIDLKASSSATVTAKMECKDIVVSVSGGSAVVLNGETRYLTLRATETCKIDTRKMETQSAVIEAATGAEVYVKAYDRLVITAKSGATIFYMGNPSILRETTAKIGFGANINKID